MRDYVVLRVVGKIMMAFMLLFAVYVHFHSKYGPGGGFQAGMILAAAIIFYAMIYGLPAARAVVPEWLVETMVAAGAMLYLLVGVAGILLGGNYLDYFVLHADPVAGQLRGIFWIELGVLITVAGVILKVFYLFAGRPVTDEDGR